MRVFFLNFLFFFLINISFAYCLSPEKRLLDPKQEDRAMSLFLEVRCPVCNGQVIENSDTEFSYQLRQLIRKKILQGESDQQIKKELIEKFGQDILISAEVNKKNIFLFILPALFSVLVAICLFIK